MTVYEITATVDSSIRTEYERYMQQRHIPDLLATGYFRSVTFTRTGNRYRISYVSDDLESYLANDADRLRADFAAHFPTGVEVGREVWEILEEWR